MIPRRFWRMMMIMTMMMMMMLMMMIVNVSSSLEGVADEVTVNARIEPVGAEDWCKC